MKSLGICVVTHQYGHFWSGVGTYATRLINALADAGHQVTVLCPVLSQGMAHPGVTLTEIKGLKFKPTLENWFLLSYYFNKSIQNLLKEKPVDIIHFVDGRDSLFCKVKNIPVVGTMNDYYFAEAPKNPLSYRTYYDDWIKRWFFYNFTRVLEKRAIRRLSFVIANCNYIMNSMIKSYGIRENLIKVVYYGMDKNEVTVKGREKEDRLKGMPSILFVGQNFQRKGLPLLIRAVADVKKVFPEVLIHVVGRVSMEKEDEMRDLAKSMNIEENILFLGQKNNDEVRRIFKKADIFAIPSLIEGLPWVIFEAMEAGIPVIGGDTGGIPEQIKDGVNGFLVKPGDWESLSKKIQQLAVDKSCKDRFVQNSYRVLEGFSLKQMVEGTVNVYSTLIRSKR